MNRLSGLLVLLLGVGIAVFGWWSSPRIFDWYRRTFAWPGSRELQVGMNRGIALVIGVLLALAGLHLLIVG